MLRSTRRKIFYTLLGLFLVVGTGIVLYADGWRVDFGTWRVGKVGQIYVRSFPSDANITLNGKPIKNETGFISKGTLIDNLLPHTYSLALEKEGFMPWHEDARVLPSLVTEFKYAVLIPRNATTVFSGPLIQGFPTKYGVVTQAADGTVRLGDAILTNGLMVTKDDQSINAALPEILMQASYNGPYYSIDLNTKKIYNLSTLLTAHGINLAIASSVARDSYASLILASTPKSMTFIDETAQRITTSTRAGTNTSFILPAAIGPSKIVWAGFMASQNTSGIYEYDPGQNAVLETSSTIPGKTAKVIWLSGNDFGILQTNGKFYRFNTNTQILTPIANDVVDVATSADGSMLATREHGSIEIFGPDETTYWRFNVPDASKIQNLIWYKDKRHLFVAYPDHVAFLDLTDASLVNFTTITTGILPHYDPDTNALYMLDNERNLVRFDFPG